MKKFYEEPIMQRYSLQQADMISTSAGDNLDINPDSDANNNIPFGS